MFSVHINWRGETTKLAYRAIMTFYALASTVPRHDCHIGHRSPFFSWNLFWGLCVMLTTSTAFIISGDWVVQQWNSYINNDLPIWNFDHLRRRLSKHVWLLKVKCRLQPKITKYEKTCVVAISSRTSRHLPILCIKYSREPQSLTLEGNDFNCSSKPSLWYDKNLV
jgi:hypothetical protein